MKWFQRNYIISVNSIVGSWKIPTLRTTAVLSFLGISIQSTQATQSQSSIRRLLQIQIFGNGYDFDVQSQYLRTWFEINLIKSLFSSFKVGIGFMPLHTLFQSSWWIYNEPCDKNTQKDMLWKAITTFMGRYILHHWRRILCADSAITKMDGANFVQAS